MYCPECGVSSTTEQKYCRTCGLDLQSVSRFLSGRAPVEPTNQTPSAHESGEQSPRRQRLQWGFIVFWVGIMVASLFAMIGNAVQNVDRNVGKMVEDLAALGGLITLGGIGLMIYSLFLPGKAGASATAPQGVLPQRSSVRLPADHPPEPVTRVTEHTTELLDGSTPRVPRSEFSRERE